MGLFDRFRAQPKWKHADPAVRLAGVEELSLDEQGLLATLAREDADAHVRRAAVRKVYDPAILKEVVGHDQDGDVREEASGMLLDLAVGAFEDSTEAESLKALDHLDDPKHLSAVAKTAGSEAVSLAALSRLTDVKLIGSVARRSNHASTRLEALGRVDDPEEVFNVALRSEHRDVALAAVERVTNIEHLKAVAARAAHKPVSRRARAMTRSLEEADQSAQAAAAAVAAPIVAAPDWNAERDKLCRVLEDAAGEQDWHTIESRLATAQARWAAIEAEGQDPARAARFAAACERAAQAAAQLKQQESARAERAEQTGRQRAERVAVCERVESLAAVVGRRAAGDASPEADALKLEDVPGEIDAVRRAWAALVTPLLEADDVERLDRRFERAVDACQRETERCRSLIARRARLAELVDQAEAFVKTFVGAEGAPPAQPASADRPRWAAIQQEWTDLGGARAAGEALASRFAEAHATMSRREAEVREREQQRQREQLQRLQQACERLDAVAKVENLTLKDGERALRDVRAALDATTSLGKTARTELGERLRAVQSTLFPRVQELREADEWARWANVGIQEDLCRKAEALREVADAGEAARQLRELQQQWKRASLVPRDRARELWERFKAAGDDVRTRADAYFAQEAVERGGNLTRKEALCQQAEALADSTDWIKAAEAIKQLQTEWKNIGPVPRGHEKAVWERFRAACDRFFTRRREDLTRRKEEWAANLARKDALIAQAEALAESEDWERGVDEIKRLQAEWKTVGPVRKSRSEDVWQRFRAACDRFFERYQQRDRVKVNASISEREEICRQVEALLPADGAAAAEVPAVEAATVVDAPVVAKQVAELRARWAQAPSLAPRDVLAQLAARYAQALTRVVAAFPDAFRETDLDADANRRKAEEICARVEAAVPSLDEPPPQESPTEVLAARLREALAANTIGGGGVAVAETDARLKSASATVREARAAWAGLGPLPADAAAGLNDRFERACRRVQQAVEKRRK